jgi:hypothetical protein
MLAPMEFPGRFSEPETGYRVLRSHPAIPIDYIPPFGDGQVTRRLNCCHESCCMQQWDHWPLLRKIRPWGINTKGIRQAAPTSFRRSFLNLW